MAYVITPEQMRAFSLGPGEHGHTLEGYLHGLEHSSLIWSETAVGGGPPLHTHACEELHVLPRGRVSYLIDGERFDVTAPCVVRIPAGAEHTFTAAGPDPVTVIAFFPHPTLLDHYRVVGTNPLSVAGGGQ